MAIRNSDHAGRGRRLYQHSRCGRLGRSSRYLDRCRRRIRNLVADRSLISRPTLRLLPDTAILHSMIVGGGATGELGSAVVRELALSDRPVRAFVRPDVSYDHLTRLDGVKVAYGDLRDAESVARSVDGVVVVSSPPPTRSYTEPATGRPRSRTKGTGRRSTPASGPAPTASSSSRRRPPRSTTASPTSGTSAGRSAASGGVARTTPSSASPRSWRRGSR